MTHHHKLEIEPIDLADLYTATRHRTEAITSTLVPEDFVVQTMECMSPPRWHLGHTCWFFEMAFDQILPDYKPYKSEFHWFFNSYYDRFGKRIERPLRGTRSRPTVEETLNYRHVVDETVLAYLSGKLAIAPTTEGLELIRLGIEHEIQHQELLVYDIKNLLLDAFVVPPELYHGQRRALPGTDPLNSRHQGPSSASTQLAPAPDTFVSFDAGVFTMGHGGSAGFRFSFDNEGPQHRVFNEHYQMATAPVTCAAFAEFIRDGGYTKSQLWLSDGWNFIQREKIQRPLYWEEEDQQLFVRDFFGRHELSLCGTEPVSHVSYYEACAFAKWAGARLPSEAEWEQACCLGTSGESAPSASYIRRSNTLDSGFWRTISIFDMPEGTLPSGLSHLFGNVWEWTSSDYAPYPGYRPTFVEYNDKWMCNQRVLRGGSYATWGAHLRPTYRNFFYPHERWMLAGFRLAKSP
jgi:ergothioneine biosynthesis protein EgtB